MRCKHDCEIVSWFVGCTMSPRDDGSQNKPSWSQTLDTPPKTLSIQTFDYVQNGNSLKILKSLKTPWTWFGGGHVQFFYGLTGGPPVMQTILSTLFYPDDFLSIFLQFLDFGVILEWLCFMTRKPNPLSPALSFSFSRSAAHLDFIQISFVCPFNSFVTVLYFSLTLVLARIHEDFARIMKTFMRNNAQLRGFFSGKTFFVQKWAKFLL